MRIRERFNPHAPFEARRGGRLAPASNDRFNPRAPCGARLNWLTVYELKPDISTHAPLAGRDTSFRLSGRFSGAFQPTRPLRGATHDRDCDENGELFQPTRPLRGATAGGQHRHQGL